MIVVLILPLLLAEKRPKTTQACSRCACVHIDENPIDTATLPVSHCSQSTAFPALNRKVRGTRRKVRGTRRKARGTRRRARGTRRRARGARRKARGKHVEHTNKHVEHAEKRVEHTEKHAEHARTGKRPRKPSSQTEQQPNVSSAGTSFLVAETKRGAPHC